MGRNRRLAGRLRVSPWFSVAVLLVAGFTLLRLYERARPGGWRIQSGAETMIADSRTKETVNAWIGEASVPGAGKLRARILPYHANPSLQEHRSVSLRERYELGEGELWRLQLGVTSKVQDGIAIRLEDVRVSDEAGEVMASLDQALADSGQDDPLVTLMRDTELFFEPDRSETVVLWGKRPWGKAKLEVARGEETVTLDLNPTDVETTELERWLRGQQTAAASTGTDERDQEIARLRAQLEEERDRRRERELEWYEYNRALAKLNLGDVSGFGVDEELVPQSAPGESAEETEGASEDESGEVGTEVEPVDPARERAVEIRLALNTLFRLEGLHGLELLEAGTLGDGWIGPVVFKTMDERGRLTGSVFAERLRLEASRSARTLTVVLEEGHESRRGREYPFADGLRRITLPYVDPEPWLDSVPELFSEDVKSPVNDDGLWNLSQVRNDLNYLLGLDTSTGWFRIRGIGGVMGTELMDVHLEEFDASGRLRRRIFADRMGIKLQEKGVQIMLNDGAVVRGDEKQSFRGGTHRIYLPSAARSEWAAARVPGLGDPPLEVENGGDG